MMIAGAAATGTAADHLVQEDFNYLASVEYVLSLEEMLTKMSALAEQLCADTAEVAEAHGDVDAATSSLGRTVVDNRGVRACRARLPRSPCRAQSAPASRSHRAGALKQLRASSVQSAHSSRVAPFTRRIWVLRGTRGLGSLCCRLGSFREN